MKMFKTNWLIAIALSLMSISCYEAIPLEKESNHYQLTTVACRHYNRQILSSRQKIQYNTYFSMYPYSISYYRTFLPNDAMFVPSYIGRIGDECNIVR